jgi:V/A-type H+-transporting ATPase subunit K
MSLGLKIPVILLGFAAVTAVGVTILMLQLSPVDAAETAEIMVATDNATPWAMISAAIAAGLSTLAAGYAVAAVGSSAVGALAEKPELLGRVLILVGLAEGIAIYGLIVAVLILNRAG